MGIKHLYVGLFFLEKVDYFPRRALPGVVHISFVGEAEHPHSRAAEFFTNHFQLFLEQGHGIGWHLLVDLAGEDEELMDKSVLLGLRNQVVGINGNTMPPDTSTWVVGQEAERLAGCALDDFDDVNACLVKTSCHLIDERDVHIPERILHDLGGLDCLDRTQFNYISLNDAAVESGDFLHGFLVDAADHARQVPDGVFSISGVDALGAMAEEKLIAGFPEDGKDYFLDGAWEDG